MPSNVISPFQQDPQTTLESLVRAIDFTNVLSSGDSIVGTPTVTASWYGGIQDSNPSTILVGSPTISGTQVLQRIHGGIPGAVYLLSFVVNTAQGNIFEGQVFFTVIQG